MGMAINNSNMKQIDSCFLLPQDLPFPLLQLIRQSPLTRGSIAFLHVSIVPNSSFQGLVKLFKGIQDRAKLILANSVRPIRNAAKHWGDVTYCTSVFQALTFYKIYDRKETKKKNRWRTCFVDLCLYVFKHDPSENSSSTTIYNVGDKSALSFLDRSASVSW